MILLAVLENGAMEHGEGQMWMKGYMEYKHLCAVGENVNHSG